MKITDVSVTEVSAESLGEFVKFSLVTVVSQYEECNNAYDDNPEARREWMESVDGDIGIAEDAYTGWSTMCVTRMLNRLDSHCMAWVEERIIQENVDDCDGAHDAAPIPLSGEVHGFPRWRDRKLAKREAVDIIQPDDHRCGGSTGIGGSTRRPPHTTYRGPTLRDVPAPAFHRHFVERADGRVFPGLRVVHETVEREGFDLPGRDVHGPTGRQEHDVLAPDGVGPNSEFNREANERFAIE